MTTHAHVAAQELFDRTAAEYRAHADNQVCDLTSLVFARRKEVVLALLDDHGASGTLLDYGMGPGVFAPDAAERRMHFVGIDIAPAMVEKAEALGIADAEYVVGDLDALSRFHRQADAVIAIGLIDYLEDPADGLRKLAECVRPGGVLLVSFRNRRAVNTLLRNVAKAVWHRLFRRSNLRPKSAFISPVHEKSFTPATLRECLEAAGLEDFDVRYHNVTPGLFVNVPVPRPVWHRWLRLDRALARYAPRPLCDAGVIRAVRAPD